MFKKKDKQEEEPLYEISATNRKMINYKAYRMTPNEQSLYFAAAFVIGAVVAYLFYGGIGKDEYGAPTFITYILDIVIMAGIGFLAGKFFYQLGKSR